MTSDPAKSREFAVDVVRSLREADFTAYWAGGCVRDKLLGRTPKDYDVATDATPDEIRRVFGRYRTLSIGAAFGVITVLGPPNASQVEVATFREDATYSDGRHPDSVQFCGARQDAGRRDFTINGLFYDPVTEEVIDYVGGQEDLKRHLIRAIGDPVERFTEDKLRMLRAIRFSSTYRFNLDGNTLEAVRRMASEITVVSPERISMEMERILVDVNRAAGVRLLLESGLAAAVLPEIVPNEGEGGAGFERSLAVIDRLEATGFSLALAALLVGCVDAAGAARVCDRWRLSNRQIDRVTWLLENRFALAKAPEKPFSMVQRTLIADGIDDLLLLAEAECMVDGQNTGDVDWCRSVLARPVEEFDPPPLVTGNDLISHGIRPGPSFSALLRKVRDAQLDDEIQTSEQALALVDRLLAKD